MMIFSRNQGRRAAFNRSSSFQQNFEVILLVSLYPYTISQFNLFAAGMDSLKLSLFFLVVGCEFCSLAIPTVHYFGFIPHSTDGVSQF